MEFQLYYIIMKPSDIHQSTQHHSNQSEKFQSETSKIMFESKNQKQLFWQKNKKTKKIVYFLDFRILPIFVVGLEKIMRGQKNFQNDREMIRVPIFGLPDHLRDKYIFL